MSGRTFIEIPLLNVFRVITLNKKVKNGSGVLRQEKSPVESFLWVIEYASQPIAVSDSQMSKTKKRILEASLTMFNELSERQVTTNHIARELGISPGNLYYHFKNKDEIIVSLYRHLIDRISGSMVLQPERKITLKDKRLLLDQMVKILWEYRFIYRDLRDTESRGLELSNIARELTHLTLDRIRLVLTGCVDAGIMTVNREDIDGLAMNNYLVLSGWQALVTGCLNKSGKLSPEDLARSAIYQILLMDKPYISSGVRAEFEQMQAEFKVSMAI